MESPGFLATSEEHEEFPESALILSHRDTRHFRLHNLLIMRAVRAIDGAQSKVETRE